MAGLLGNYDAGLLARLLRGDDLQDVASRQSPFQRSVSALTIDQLRGGGIQRWIDAAETDADLRTLKRKLDNLGIYTGSAQFGER